MEYLEVDPGRCRSGYDIVNSRTPAVKVSMKPAASPMSQHKAYKNCRWKDLVSLSPEEASTVMGVVLGQKILPIDAAKAIKSARRDHYAGGLGSDAVNDFYKSQFDIRGTCTLHRAIVGKRI